MASDTDFRFLAENSADMLCRFGVDRRFVYVSPSSTAILGWTPEEIIAMPPFAMVYPDDLAMLIETIDRDMQPGVVAKPVTLRYWRKDGSFLWMEVSPRIVQNATTGEVTEAVIVMRDVTARKQMEDRLAALALTDGLTGIANRRAFDEALTREWKRSLRDGSQLSLILLDVDHFKGFNDHHGHQVGDDCLCSVASAVSKAVRREIDTVARYGGEEIAVILPCTDCVGAVTVAESIRQAIVSLQIAHPENMGCGGVVTASFGVSTVIVREGSTVKMPNGLLMSADHALYKAKHGGRNRISSTILMTSSTPV